ncbi:ABC transporter substrate-binding protein [Psychrilyobacter atlanticus]|uniref:ABC transporter substrate-binding protein n=1 Tax=Psychrilyobacter atlanticus TaxID=271091 RepID=UPI0003F6BC6F|nr:ABC transporter substrate-binding protein [Psychrilyobacter atlanticus]
MKKILLCLVSLFLFIACGEEKEKKVKDTLIFSQSSELRTLDPQMHTDIYSRRVLTNVFDRLVEKNIELEIVPGLAKNWEYLDETTVLFNLKEGILFHNGSELTSEDVKYSLERAKESPMIGVLFSLVSEIETPDKYTVIIKTEEPFGALFHHLSHIGASIVNKEYNENTDEVALNPMGTGAYKMIDWKAGDRVVLEAHDKYYKGEAPIKYVHVRNIPEENSRVIGLETGEIDISMDIASISRTSVIEHKDLTLHEVTSLGVSYMGLNTEKGALKDKKVRQAIALGIDRDIIIETILMGAVTKANGLLGPGVFGYSKDATTLGYDQEKAKQLLKEAGYEKGIDMKMTISGSETNSQIAQIMQAQLKEIGINLSLEQIEWGAFLNITSKGETDLYLMGWSNSSGDADYGFTPMLHSSMKGNAGNRSFFENSEFDALLEAAKIELDEGKRKVLYAKVQDIMNEEVPIYPTNFSAASGGVNNQIVGYVQSELNLPYFHDYSFRVN